MENSFFGEWVEYRNDEEFEEAIIYLKSWKKFFLRKIPTMNYVSESIINRPKTESFSGLVSTQSTVGIKIEMSGKIPDNVFTPDQIKIK